MSAPLRPRRRRSSRPSPVDGGLERVAAGRRPGALPDLVVGSRVELRLRRRPGPSRPGGSGRRSALSGQPSSEPWLPGIETSAGCGTGPTGRRRPGGALPTTPHVDATPRSPSWSRTTTRYSSIVPLARPLTSWKTRYGALSSVPSRCQARAHRAPARRSPAGSRRAARRRRSACAPRARHPAAGTRPTVRREAVGPAAAPWWRGRPRPTVPAPHGDLCRRRRDSARPAVPRARPQPW